MITTAPLPDSGSIVLGRPCHVAVTLPSPLADGATATLVLGDDVLSVPLVADDARTSLTVTLTVAQVATVATVSHVPFQVTTGTGDALVALVVGHLSRVTKWDGKKPVTVSITAGATEAALALTSANAAAVAQADAEAAADAAGLSAGTASAAAASAATDAATATTKASEAAASAAAAAAPAGASQAALVSGLTRIYTTSRSFAGIAVSPDRRRGRVTIRNIGGNPFSVAVRATLTANYNVIWTGAETVQPGEEFYSDQVAGNFYVGPSADGVAIEYEAFAEAVI